MMDEIELQLCLHIGEPAMGCSMPPPPLPSQPTSDSNCRVDYKGQPDQGQTWQGQGTPLLHGARRKKRSAECLGDGIDGNGDGVGEEDNGEDGLVSPMIGSLGCEDGYEPGSYLRRPPRKRARTLFAVDGKGRIRIGGDDGGVGDDTAALGIDGKVADLGVPLPDIGGVLDNNTRHSEHAVKDMGVQSVNMEENMDIDSDVREDAIESIPSQSPARRNTFHRPQQPFMEFFEGAYIPALLDSLSSPRDEKGHRSHQFLIYEDPEDMDIDGVGYFETSWYFSPEDEKENIEGGGQEQHQHSRDHDHEHEQANEHNQEDPSYDFSFDDRDSYNHALTTQQHTDHNITTAHDPSQMRPTETERRHPQGRPLTPSAYPREFESPDHSGRDDDVRQFSFLSNETPLPITPRIDTLGLEYTLPSPTSLSATEISLRALLPSQTAEGDMPTQPENNSRPLPRRHRRVNGYCC